MPDSQFGFLLHLAIRIVDKRQTSLQFFTSRGLGAHLKVLTCVQPNKKLNDKYAKRYWASDASAKIRRFLYQTLFAVILNIQLLNTGY